MRNGGGFELTVPEKDGNLRRGRQRPANVRFLLSRQDVIDFVRSFISGRRGLAFAAALALFWLLGLPSARAQLPLGPLEDATVLPPAAFRFGGFFDYATATRRF